MHVREPEAAALEEIYQPFVIHAEQVEHRRVEIMHVDFVIGDVVTEVIRLAKAFVHS